MDVVTCNGCTFIFAEPRRVPKGLPCGHTYCKKCMDQLAAIDNYLCPYCRQPWGTKVDDLVTNLTIMDIAKQPEYLDRAMEADIDDELVCLQDEMLRIKDKLTSGNIDPYVGLAKMQELKERSSLVMAQEEDRRDNLLLEEKKAREALAFLEKLKQNLSKE